jgi:hypothetical protein
MPLTGHGTADPIGLRRAPGARRRPGPVGAFREKDESPRPLSQSGPGLSLVTACQPGFWPDPARRRPAVAGSRRLP